MAIAIKPIPVLTGIAADRFNALAEANERQGVQPTVPQELKESIRKMMERSRNIVIKHPKLRMITSSFDLFGRCEFARLTEELASLPFTCGDSDLEDFFHNEAVLYAKARLGKTYCFIDNNGEATKIVAFFTVSNDRVKTTFIPKSSTNKIQRKIPGQKHLRTYPAVLIGRLGVNTE